MSLHVLNFIDLFIFSGRLVEVLRLDYKLLSEMKELVDSPLKWKTKLLKDYKLLQ